MKHPARPARIRIRPDSSGCLESRVFKRVERARARGCGGRRSRPAQRAEAKRTPEQPGRGRRDAPIRFEWTHVSPATP